MWVGALVCVISLNEVEVHPTIPQLKTIKWTAKHSHAMLYFMFFGIIMTSLWIEYTN